MTSEGWLTSKNVPGRKFWNSRLAVPELSVAVGSVQDTIMKFPDGRNSVMSAGHPIIIGEMLSPPLARERYGLRLTFR